MAGKEKGERIKQGCKAASAIISDILAREQMKSNNYDTMM